MSLESIALTAGVAVCGFAVLVTLVVLTAKLRDAQNRTFGVVAHHAAMLAMLLGLLVASALSLWAPGESPAGVSLAAAVAIVGAIWTLTSFVLGARRSQSAGLHQ